AFGDGKLAEQEETFARRGGDPIRIAAASVQEHGLSRPGRGFGEVDEFVLDLERAQSLKFFQREDVSHYVLLFERCSSFREWRLLYVSTRRCRGWRTVRSAISRSSRLGQQHDNDHSPDRQQRVADGVGDGVAK